MGAEWIKVENHLHEKTEVAIIADITGLDTDQVVGKLIRVWAWASRNCYADGVTDVRSLRLIREMTRSDTFDEGMIKAGWMSIKGEKVVFANFDRHISQTAKDRALASIRMAKKRAQDSVTPMLRSERNEFVTRKRIDKGVQSTPIKIPSCL